MGTMLYITCLDIYFCEQCIECWYYALPVVVDVVYFILSRLIYQAFSANLGLLCMPHPNLGPLV